LLVTLFALAGCGQDSSISEEVASDVEDTQPELSPSFVILNERASESPGQTLLQAEILLQGQLSEEAVRDALEAAGDELKGRTGFRWHTHPTALSVRAFASSDHQLAGLWVGLLSESSIGRQVQIDQRQINAETASPEDRHGLSEDQRRQVYQQIVRIEDRGLRGDALTAAKRELADQHGISIDQLTEIADEGLRKSWPLPPM
jgi:hypothetical protein